MKIADVRDRDLRGLFAERLAHIQRMDYEAEERRAKADPLAHKYTRVTTNTSYRHYRAGRNGKNQDVRYCYATHRNVAGFFLGWRETIRRDGIVKRDQWVSRRVKQRVVEICQRRANKMLAAARTPTPEED